MKTLEEQIANKCIHFNGISNKVCENGIPYEDVKVKGAKPIKIPCIKDIEFSGGNCPFVEFPSKDVVDRKVKELTEAGEMQLRAYKLVKEHIEKTKEEQGYIKCPECGGRLKYIRASINKHIWAKCKCGLGWME